MNLQVLPDVQRVKISAALGLPGEGSSGAVSPAGWDFWVGVSQGASINLHFCDVLCILDVPKFSISFLCTNTHAHPKIVSS